MRWSRSGAHAPHSAAASYLVYEEPQPAPIETPPVGTTPTPATITPTDAIVPMLSTVSADTLCERLGRPASKDAENWLHATIYRLRRRIELVRDDR